MDQKCQTSVLPKNNFEVHIDVLLKKASLFGLLCNIIFWFSFKFVHWDSCGNEL